MIVIFTSIEGKIVEKCILDEIPHVGDTIQINDYDLTGVPTGSMLLFPVTGRTFIYDRMEKPASTLSDIKMHQSCVHVALGDKIGE